MRRMGWRCVFLAAAMVSFGMFAEAKSPSGAQCVETGGQSACTSRVEISNAPALRFSMTGLVPGAAYQIRVIQPDGSSLSGDGSGDLWPKGHDTVRADVEGDLQYDYVLRDLSGDVNVEVTPLGAPFPAIAGDVSSDTDGQGGVATSGVANPPRPTACGLDIVLVMDSSGSVSAAQLNQMRTAFINFVNAFLPNTPTQFAVVDFDTQAFVLQGFTSNVALLTSAINTPTSGGFTNWDDALYDARNLFPHRLDKPDMIVFASDGNPNYRYGHLGQGAASTSTSNALAAAVAEANIAKKANIRIETFAIGSGITLSNLVAISSADAVTSTGFDTLAQSLANLAVQLCGGTVNVTKLLDADGNLGTTGDRTAGIGWTFSTVVDPPDFSTPASGMTDGSGQISFFVDHGADLSAVLDIVETLQAGHTFLSASCTKGGNPVGTPAALSVNNISITPQDIVACTFINHKLPVCGNGLVEFGEQCDDGNTAAGDCCSPTCLFEPNGSSCAPDSNVCTLDVCNGAGVCTHPNAPMGTSCNADGNLCTNDHCNGFGQCVFLGNVSCQAANAPCEGGAVCNPSTGLCVDQPDAPLGTACNLDGNLCTVDQCNGTGSCVFISNVSCQAASPPCEGGEVCNPSTGSCVAQPDAPYGTFCNADGDLCTVDKCNGTGQCIQKTVVSCPGPTGPCDAGQQCNSGTGMCQSLPDPAAGTPCDNDANLCTVDQCNGTGSCVLVSTVTCPGSTGACDAGQQCDGATGSCVNLPDPPTGTPCEADANLCTIDKCNGQGACVFDSNVSCPGPTGPCDAGTACSPSTGACNPLPDPPVTTSCEADGNLCTIDHCDGVGNCVLLNNVSCQAPNPPCEAGAVCQPATGLCLNLPDAPISTTCELDGNLCTDDHCNGSGVCVFGANRVCQSPNPPCEGGEVCIPGTGLCSALPDAPTGTSCEIDGNLCTIDVCNGSGMCNFLTNVTCAGPVPPCEAGQACNPASGQCFDLPDAPLSTACERDGNLCTQDHCNGSGSCVQFGNVSCAPPVPPCEGGETCTPATGACTALPDAPSGTSCENDGNLCTIDVCNGLGVCNFQTNVSCDGPVPPCEAGEACNPSNGQCFDLPDAPLSTSCERDGNLCTLDHCDGSGMCVQFGNASCAPPVPPCEGGETCNPTTGACDSLPDAPTTTTCETDGNLCTVDRCNGTGSCATVSVTTCPPPTGTCDAGLFCDPGTGVCDDLPDPAFGTACERDGNLCTHDQCDGAGSCVTFGKVSCPGSTGECDAGENCVPATGLCEMLADPPVGSDCEEDGNLCTIEECDGQGNCMVVDQVSCPGPTGPCDSGTACNPSTGACDPLPDPVAGTACERDGDLCTVDACDGTGLCLQVSVVTCAAPSSVCDGGEVCNPATGSCDALPETPAGTTCNLDSNACTIDRCNGLGDCVVVDQVTCPGPVGPCDSGTACNTTTGACDPLPDPPAGTFCERDGDLCTVDACNGSGKCVQVDVVVCAGSDSVCDGGEVCNSATGMCDSLPETPSGTTCDLDDNACTIDRCDGQGACVNVSSVVCQQPTPPCEAGSVCNTTTGACDALPDAPTSTPCERDGNLCTIDHCDGNGQCVLLNNVVCAPAIPPCEGGETCQPMTGLCVAVADAPSGTPCESDSDPCTSDVCSGTGSCTHPINNLCGRCCLPDLGCEEMPAAACQSAGGIFAGTRTQCLGDSDGDGVDDQCDLCPGEDDHVVGQRICCGTSISCVTNSDCPSLSLCVPECQCPEDIPTVSEWGLVVLTLLLMVGSKLRFSRRVAI